jgi:hypothetical protein
MPLGLVQLAGGVERAALGQDFGDAGHENASGPPSF